MRPVIEVSEDIKVADQKGRLTLGNRYAGRRFVLQERPDGSTLLTPVLVIPETEQPITNRILSELFSDLTVLEDDWDRRGSVAPTPALISSARETVALFQASAIARGIYWSEPHVGSNERGEILLEWWQANRNLTIYVRSAHQIEYLKSWGIDIQTEMEDGELERISDFTALSHWLHES